MNFTLNGHTVNVRTVDIDTCGGRTGIAITVDGRHVAFRPTMDAALTVATIYTSDACPLSNMPGYREHVHRPIR